MCLLHGDLFSTRDGREKASLHGSLERLNDEKFYKIMSFLWNHGPEERVSIQGSFVAIILVHKDSNPWLVLISMSLIQDIGPQQHCVDSTSCAWMCWVSWSQPISRPHPRSPPLTMATITKVQKWGGTITSALHCGTLNLVSSPPSPGEVPCKLLVPSIGKWRSMEEINKWLNANEHKVNRNWGWSQRFQFDNHTERR